MAPASKAPYLDLLDPAFGLAGSNFPEKIEGLAFGPDLADGRHLLLVTSDNDFVATQPTRFFAFALDNLPEYQAQQAVPEPGTILLLTTGLIGLLGMRGRQFTRTH